MITIAEVLKKAQENSVSVGELFEKDYELFQEFLDSFATDEYLMLKEFAKNYIYEHEYLYAEVMVHVGFLASFSNAKDSYSPGFLSMFEKSYAIQNPIITEGAKYTPPAGMECKVAVGEEHF